MVIGSIDIMAGKAVQLVQGRKKVLEADDPAALAQQFKRFGEIAVIDLDAALGRGVNRELVHGLCRQAPCRVGGGIRSAGRARELLEDGAEKIILGTAAFGENRVNHGFLHDVSRVCGRGRLIVAVDTWKGKIVTHGWQRKTLLSVTDILPELEVYCDEVLLTCVEREGKMAGTDRKMIEEIKGRTSLNMTVAGGIATLKEIEELARLHVNMQLGMVLYTGIFTLGEAFIASLNWRRSLIPVVTVDENSQVLMQAFTSRDALKRTFRDGRVWYYSRSRDSLWLKGESSGNFQHFLRVRQDCDGDALLMTVRQEGAACHRGRYSCFDSRYFSLYELYHVIRQRLEQPAARSYTSTLDDGTVREKLLEEARELAEASGRDEIIWEAADVLYFLLVLLARERVNLDEILRELKRRRRKSHENSAI